MPDPRDPPKKNDDETKAPTARKRRPYEPPRIVSKDKLEGRANVCDPFAGKTAPPACGVNRS